jgi:4a-hydroxytetrahydrobiopterin dehydratase
MNNLAKKKCNACDGDTPAFDKSEIHKYLKKVDGWDVKSDKKKSFYLIKNFKFKNFEKSQIFVNQIGRIAEEENHHPDISFGWGYCNVKIFTHAIKGLAENDFILAAKIDNI